MTKRYEIVSDKAVYGLSIGINYMIDYYKHVEVLGPPFFDPKTDSWCQAVLITE